MVTHLTYYISVKEMAKRRGFQTTTINDHIRKGKISFVKMALAKFVYDAEAAAAYHAQHPEHINVNHKTLVWLPDFAESMGIAPRTLYEEIIFERINAFTAGDKIFLLPDDPTVLNYLALRAKEKAERNYRNRNRRKRW